MKDSINTMYLAHSQYGFNPHTVWEFSTRERYQLPVLNNIAGKAAQTRTQDGESATIQMQLLLFNLVSLGPLSKPTTQQSIHSASDVRRDPRNSCKGEICS